MKSTKIISHDLDLGVLFLGLSPIFTLFISYFSLPLISLSLGLLCSLLWGLSAILWRFQRNLARVLACIAILLSVILLAPKLYNNPIQTLGFGVFFLSSFALVFHTSPKQKNVSSAALRKRKFSALASIIISCASLLLYTTLAPLLALSSLAVAVYFHFPKVLNKEQSPSFFLNLLSLLLPATLVYINSNLSIYLCLIVALLWILVDIKNSQNTKAIEELAKEFFSQPAKVLLGTFLSLSLLGALLLSLPIAQTQPLRFIDTSFIAVSGVCVTGLSVLDISKEFTVLGQVFLLILIQLGGLGIMSVAAIALRPFGKRISLRQEVVFSKITETAQHDSFQALARIVKLTLVTELIGASLLSIAFILEGKTFLNAVWEGVFTAVSAFCNAGFSLQSNNLTPYALNPFILSTISLLIVIGGLAPATTILFPQWIRRKPIPVPAALAFQTSLILLIIGFLFSLTLEWNGLLKEFGLADKLSNAWFLSSTLRTAGFNSFDLAFVSSPLYLIMLFLMFVGGSPGGVAGGIKTTTLAILIRATWAHVNNRSDVVIRNRRIRHHSVFRAMTITMLGFMLVFTFSLLLELTQQIPMRLLIFEAVSALATVGLTLGATPMLDDFGKIIIIIAMFIGRIGPLTIFILLAKDSPRSENQYPDLQISLT